MLFHEIYGSYYQTVSSILREAVRGDLTRKRMMEIVREKAFGESALTIPDAMRSGRWKLLYNDYTTLLENEPEMPLTLLEKRWLKALLADPRIRLFFEAGTNDSDDESDTDGTIDSDGLRGVEPLFLPDDFVWFDRYAGGDDYQDPQYAAHFRTILKALRSRRNLYILQETRYKNRHAIIVTPHYLEYSEKDNCFRLFCAGKDWNWTINVSRILECRLEEEGSLFPLHPARRKALTFELTDERNALDRVLLHFSHLEKETKRLDEKTYRVTLHYDWNDETEMVIRILSFGPMIRVTDPPAFIEHLRARIHRQQALL